MVTLRGAVGQSFTSSSNAISLPGGSAAGDWAVLMTGDGFNFSGNNPTGIINWAWAAFRSVNGNTIVWIKQLTAADITAGSVTGNYVGSYGGHTAIAVAQAAAGVIIYGYVSDNLDSTFTTGRTITRDVKSGMVGIYLAQKRKDGSTPACSFNVGTLDNATAVANFAGAIAHQSYGSDQTITLTSTWDSNGQTEFLAMAVFADTFNAAVDTDVEFGATRTSTALLYKGRATATDDAAGVP